jgi:hypothetical protein
MKGGKGSWIGRCSGSCASRKKKRKIHIGALSWARVASQDARLVPAQQPAASSGQVRTVFKLPFLSVIIITNFLTKNNSHAASCWLLLLDRKVT